MIFFCEFLWFRDGNCDGEVFYVAGGGALCLIGRSWFKNTDDQYQLWLNIKVLIKIIKNNF
jgi:hypothetical protein